MNSIRSFYKGLSFILLISCLGLTACDSPISSDETKGDLSIKNEEATYGHAAKKGDKKNIPNQYIVVFNKNVKNAGNSARQLAQASGGEIKFVYETAIKGFSISLPAQASPRAIEALQNNPNVAFIEQDTEVYALESQSNSTWGIDRSDQRDLPLNGIYNYNSTGGNVTAYIVDTGINYSHEDFGGRAAFGFDAFGGDGEDCDGHGTHVAGTVGGSTWGIAKDVDLVSVRVLDCRGSGTISGVVAGIDWISANASGPSVANMSLGGGASTALDNAVENSIAAGITYVVAAGNSGADACNYSPARAKNALTIGATTSSDSRASYSNYGSCVDLFAPGSGITSAWTGSSTSTNTISGTSMASPHVAGTVALYLQNNSTATTQDVESVVISYATQNIVSNSNTSNNHLVYTLFDEEDGGSGDGDGSNETDGGDTAPVANNFDINSYKTGPWLKTDISWSVSDADGDLASVKSELLKGNSVVTSQSNSISGSSASGVHELKTRDTADAVRFTVTDKNGNSVSEIKNIGGNDDDEDNEGDDGDGDGGGDEPTPPGDFDLSANGSKNKGKWTASLSWDGASSSNVDIIRDGNIITTTTNSGSYTDNTQFKGGGSLTYQVCEAGSDICSNEATVNF